MSQGDNNWQQQAWQQPATPQPPQPGSCPPPMAGAPVQAPVAYAAAPSKKNRGWIVAIVVVAALLILILAGMASCTSIVSSSFSSLGTASSSSESVDFLSQDTVGVITIDGTIQYDGTTASPEGLKAQLDRAEENSHIKAIVLRVNSGGGTATAGEEMTTYLKQFSKPIVVSSASINASAAYELSSQADYIYTAKTTAIGAIGTVFQITDLSGLLEKLGIKVDNVTSSDSKDSSYGTRALTDEERSYYQAMVQQINETFIASVAEGRGMSVESVRALATGMTFTGMDAVNNGLADEIGTKEDAVAKAAQLAGLQTYGTVDLKPSSDGLNSLLGLLSQNSVSADDLVSAFKELEADGTIVR